MPLPEHACCTVPAVQWDDFKPKGEYETLAGHKTYVTGNSSAKRGLLYIYDVFGLSNQALHAADILGHGDSDNQLRVFLPDLLDGVWAQTSWYASQSEENEKAKKEFFDGPAKVPECVEEVKKILAELKKSTGIADWAIFGACWGSKLVTVSLQNSTEVKTAIGVHPAFVDPKDAPGIKVPYLYLPSKDEPADAVKGFEKGLTVKHEVVTFDEHHHGFMGARSDLNNDQHRQGFEKGYKLVLNWLHETL